MSSIKEEPCPLCEYPTAQVQTSGAMNDMYYAHCPRCGNFGFSYEFKTFFPKNELEKLGYVYSGISRELTETGGNQPEFLYKENESVLSSSQLPDLSNPKEKALKLLDRIKNRSKHYGFLVELNYETDYPMAYAVNEDELIALIQFLEDTGLIFVKSRTNADATVALTAEGWNMRGVLEKNILRSDQGFIAIWFDNSLDETTDAICEVVKQSGFRPMCIKHEHFSEKIMDKALGEIRKSKFMVVDLTGSRGSVFFEAGFGFGLGLDIIYVIKSEDGAVNPELEFYVRHYQCLRYRDNNELKEILADAIKARIK